MELVDIILRKKCLVEEQFTCEQCKTNLASIQCLDCLQGGFYYCRECADFFHSGNRKCSHDMSLLVNVAQLREESTNNLKLLDKTLEDREISIKKFEEEDSKMAEKAEDMIAECRYVFNELRTLLNSKECELVNYCESIKTANKESCKSKMSTLYESIEQIKPVRDKLKNTLELLDTENFNERLLEISDEVSKVKDECCNDDSQLFTLSLRSLSFLPDSSHIKDLIYNYCIPNVKDWNEGDTIIVSAPSVNIDANGYFWLLEQVTPSTINHLSLLSQSLSNAIAINRVKICTSFSAGELCTAYYPKDQLWHRAVIESAYSTDKGPMVSVRYIDYGNSCELFLDCIATLPSKFHSYPFQCKRCRFATDEIVLWNISREPKWKYSDLVKERVLNATIVEKFNVSNCAYPLFTVKLYHKNIDIGDEVIKVAKNIHLKQDQLSFPSTDIRYKYKSTWSTISRTTPTYQQEHDVSNDGISHDGVSCDSVSENDVRPPVAAETVVVADSNKEEERVLEETSKEMDEANDVVLADESVASSVEIDQDVVNEGDDPKVELENNTLLVDTANEETSVTNEESTQEEHSNTHQVEIMDENTVAESDHDLKVIESVDIVNETHDEASVTLSPQRDDDTNAPPLHNRVSLSISPAYSSECNHNSVGVPQEGGYESDQESECGLHQGIRKPGSQRVKLCVSTTTDSDTPIDNDAASDCAVVDKDTPSDKGMLKLSFKLESTVANGNESVGVVGHDFVPSVHPMVTEDAKLNVVVNSSLSPSGIVWCQLVLDDLEMKLYSNLFDKLQAHAANKGGLYTPVFFNSGDLCMGLYHEDMLWYRGVVESIDEENQLIVRFTDYGNVDVLQIADVMGLKNEFRRLPFQAIQCSLSYNMKTLFSTEECQKFDDIFLDDNLGAVTATVLSIADGIVSIKLQVKEQDVVELISSKKRTYSFDMPPEEDNIEGLTWAERMDSPINTSAAFHSDSDVFHSKPTDFRGGVSTDIEDHWSEPLNLSLQQQGTSQEQKEGPFQQKKFSNKDRKAKATTVTVNKSTSTGNTRNKARSHINTSGIVKYLGHEANSGTTKFRKSSTGSTSERKSSSSDSATNFSSGPSLKQSKEQEPAPNIISLYVRNIPVSYTSDDVAKGFSKYGEVHSVRRVFSKSKNYLMFFVDMEDACAQNAVKHLNGKIVPGGTKGLYICLDNKQKFFGKKQ